MNFETKEEVTNWCKTNMNVEILFTSSAISLMKSAATKGCRLCMKERTSLFRHFGRNKSPKNNMMNSRKELHGRCICAIKFIRLQSVENKGADEAAS